jgi:DNA-binding NarL/FixJ family response regulator
MKPRSTNRLPAPPDTRPCGRAFRPARPAALRRPRKLTPHQRREAIEQCDAGETLTDIARSYNVSHSTISRP